MANQTVGGAQYIVKAYAKPDLLYYLKSCYHGRLRAKERLFTLLAYFALMLSSILSPLGLSASSGHIWTKSLSVLCSTY